MQLHRTTGDFRRGLSLATTTMVLWAMLPIALKIVLQHLDAPTIIAVRFAVSSALLAALLHSRKALPRFADLRERRWILLVIATLFLAANYYFYMAGLDWTTPANAQVLIQLAPLLLAVGGIVVFREPFNGLQWFGLAVLVAGMLAFSSDQVAAFLDTLDRYLLGSAMMGIAAVTWAIYGLAQKQLLTWWPSQSIMLCLYVGCTVLFAPWCDFGAVLRLDAVSAAVLLFCCLNTFVAYGSFAEALAHWEASRVSAVLALTPITTLFLVRVVAQVMPGWLAAEHLGWLSFAGAGLVVVGSMLVSLGQRLRRAAR